jgi:hypothetical protein
MNLRKENYSQYMTLGYWMNGKTTQTRHGLTSHLSILRSEEILYWDKLSRRFALAVIELICTHE